MASIWFWRIELSPVFALVLLSTSEWSTNGAYALPTRLNFDGLSNPGIDLLINIDLNARANFQGDGDRIWN